MADRDRELVELRRQLDEVTNHQAHTAVAESLRAAVELIEASIDTLTDHPEPTPPPAPRQTRPVTPAATPVAPPTPTQPPPQPPRPLSAPPEPTTTRFRAGADRMINALATMAPLHLTKAQWATVAHMKRTGGTWSTYLSEIRRAGLIDETPAGFTLTQAGWDYVGRRPQPMSATELQQHYLSILRAGAARMLQAIIDAYPEGLTKAEIADTAGVAASGGTFSTYLSELRRNGLVEQHGDKTVATDILMHGADTESRI